MLTHDLHDLPMHSYDGLRASACAFIGHVFDQDTGLEGCKLADLAYYPLLRFLGSWS